MAMLGYNRGNFVIRPLICLKNNVVLKNGTDIYDFDIDNQWL